MLQAFTPSNAVSPIASLPPPLSRLPEIVANLENLRNGTAEETNLIDSRGNSDSSYAYMESNKRLPTSTLAYATTTNQKNGLTSSFSRFYLPTEENITDFLHNTKSHQPIPEPSAISSPILKPKAVRPTTVKSAEVSLNDQTKYQLQNQHSPLTEALITSKVVSAEGGRTDDDQVTLKELLKKSVFTGDALGSFNKAGITAFEGKNNADYDDPCVDDTYESVGTCFSSYEFVSCILPGHVVDQEPCETFFLLNLFLYNEAIDKPLCLIDRLVTLESYYFKPS